MPHFSTLQSITLRSSGRFALLSSLTIAVVVALQIATARAQEPALPQPAAQEQRTPSPPADAPNPTATVPPPLLIPPDILPMPDSSAPLGSTPNVPSVQQLDEELKPKPLSEASENYRLQIEWRKLRNQATNDPAVKAARAATERAHTDLERRGLLAKYFNVFFDKMIAIGPPEMKAYLNDHRREYLRALPQPRVRPMPGVAAAAAAPPIIKRDRAGEPATLSGTALTTPSPSPSISPVGLP